MLGARVNTTPARKRLRQIHSILSEENMKKLYVLASILMLASLALSACGGAATPTAMPVEPGDGIGGLPDLGGREIKIAVENAYNPFNFMDEATGKAVGYDYDLFGEACKRLNCKPTFVQTSWDSIVAVMGGTGQAEFDIAADGITVTAERAQHVDFSTPYIKLSQQLLVQAGETRFASVEELSALGDFKVGAQPGTTNWDLSVEKFGEDHIVAYDPFGLIIEALLNGDIDATVIDNVAGEGYIGANPDKLKLVGDPLTSEELGFVFPKGSDLLKAINLVLAEMEADGMLDAIYAKWFPTQ